MNILYVTPESQVLEEGGAGTYIYYAANGMRKLGHNVFLLTWKNDTQHITYDDCFTENNSIVLNVNIDSFSNKYNGASYQTNLAKFLQKHIQRAVDMFEIDVIESVDFGAPCYYYFSDISKKDVVLSTFNHGCMSDIVVESSINSNIFNEFDYANERHQLRRSDLVITPSYNAKERLAKRGITDNVHIVQEPFEFKIKSKAAKPVNIFYHIGRVSIQKGIHRSALYLNTVSHENSIDSIQVIGKITETPYKNQRADKYFLKKISSDIEKKVHFFGQLPRNIMLNILKKGGFLLHLAKNETFSYSFLEAVDNGIMPICFEDTAMAEFFPERNKKALLPQQPRLTEIAEHFDYISENYSKIITDIQNYNQKRLAPETYAKEISRLYEDAIKSKRKAMLAPKQEITADDVTVLMPVYNPSEEFLETIDSLVNQSLPVKNMIIYDDGSEKDSFMHFFRYAKMMLPFVNIIRRPNAGLMAARMELIHNCNTKYSIFLDADDILHNSYLQEVVDAANSDGCEHQAYITLRANFGNSNEFVSRTTINDEIIPFSSDHRMTGMIQTQVLKEIGFDTFMSNGEADDWGFWLSFYLEDYRAHIIEKPLFFWRGSDNSMSANWNNGQKAGTAALIRSKLLDSRSDKLNLIMANAIYRHMVVKN